jgi:hypothetical protein
MKVLRLAVLLSLVPVASSAGIYDYICQYIQCNGGVIKPPVAAVPEPSGALIMGAALVVLAAARGLRK